MNRLIVAAVFLLVSVASSACIYVSEEGAGARATRTSKTAPFDAVSIDRSFDFVDIEICEDCESEIEIVGGEHHIDSVVIDVHEGLMELSGSRALAVDGPDLIATIRTRSLSSLTLTSSADVSLLGIDTERFEIVSTGSGDITAQGDVPSFHLTVSGSGNVNAFDLEAEAVDLTVTGSGDVSVCAYEKLTARLTGSGDLTYDCGASDRDITSTGSGSVGIR